MTRASAVVVTADTVWGDHDILRGSTSSSFFRLFYSWKINRIDTRRRQVCVQPSTSVVNMTLPAFAAERRAAAPLLVSAGSYYRWISHVRGTLSSKPAARRCIAMGQTDGQTRQTDRRSTVSQTVLRTLCTIHTIH